MVAKNTPSLPANVDRQLRAAIEKMAETTDTGAGLRGNPEDRYIRVVDLLNMGLAKKLGGAAQRLVSGQNLVSDSGKVMTIPPKPEGLDVNGGIGTVFLTWRPVQELYSNHSYTEIWRAESDNIDSAVMIAQTAITFMHTDSDVHYTKTYYYWIRFVSTADVRGPWNSPAGTSGQTKQDPAELLDLLAGEIRESQLHSELTTRIDLIDEPLTGLIAKSQQNAQAIVAEAQSRAQAVADEAVARAQAITAEVAARQSAVSGEANNRATAILAEATARQNAIDTAVQTLTAADQNNAAAIQNEVTARTTAVAAEAVQRNTLAAQFRGDYTGSDLAAVTSGLLYQEKLQRTTAVDSLTQQTALLSAGANTQFDHVKLWHFDALEGWTGNYATPTLNAGWLRYANGADPYAQVAVNIDGAKYPQIRARIRKIGNPVWRGYANYSTVNAPALTHLTAIPAPEFKDGIANLTWNMTGDWLLSNVTALVISPTYQSATDYCEIDWIAVGRPSPGASSAELYSEQLARANADSAMASDIQNVNSSLAGKASTSALSALDTRVTNAEGALVSQSTQTTSLSAKLLMSPIIPSDFLNGLGDWTYARHGKPDAMANLSATTYASTIVNDDPDFGVCGQFSMSGAGNNVLTKNVIRVVPGRIYTVKIRFKVTGSDGSASFNCIASFMPADFSATLSPAVLTGGSTTVTTLNEITTLTFRLSTDTIAGVGKITAGTVYFRYGLRLNSTETGLTVRIGSITCTDDTDLIGLQNADSASATANSVMDARVADAEDAITSASTSITNLEARVAPSANLIPYDTEFKTDFGGWGLGTNNTGYVAEAGRNTNNADTWRITGTNCIWLYLPGKPALNTVCDYYIPDAVPIIAGKKYCFSALGAVHRGKMLVYMHFKDSNGNVLSGIYGQETSAYGGKNAADWASLYCFGTPPANAAYVSLVVRFVANGTEADPYMWFCRPSLTEVDVGTTTPPRYAPSGGSATTASVASSLETLTNTVMHNTTGLAAVGQKAVDLQTLVGTSAGGAFESLKSAVYDMDTGLSATANKLVSLSARLDVKNLNKNTVFTDYWGAWGSGPTINSSGAAEFNITDGQHAGIITVIDFPNYHFIDVELTFTLHTGEIYGAGLYFERFNVQTGQWVGELVKLSDYYSYGSLVLGKKVTLKLRLKRPANFPHMTQAATLYVMANFSPLGAMAAKAITFHSCVVTASDKTADALEILNTQVQDTSTGLAATSNKILQLNAQLGMGSAETYSEFKARVTQDQQGRVDALSTQVTALSAVVDGGILSNLWKHDSECNGLGFLPSWGWVKLGSIQGDLIQNYSGTTKPDACGFLGQDINASAGTLVAVMVYKGDSGYGIPVIAGNSYSFRCKTMTTAGQYFNVALYFWDNAGSLLSSTVAGGCAASAGGANIDNWADLVTSHLTAPANAAYLQINVYVMGTNTPAGVFGMTRFQVTSGASDTNANAYKANQLGTFATISSQLAAQANANGTTASRIDTFKSAMLGNAGGTLPQEFAAIQQQFETINGVSAKWSVKTQVGDLVGGIGLLNKDGRIELAINADRIAFYPPEGVGSSGEQARLFVWDAELGRLVLNQVYVDKIFANEVYANKIFVNATVGGQANFVRANLGTALIDDIAGSASLATKVDFVAAGLWGKDLGGGARNMISSLTLGGLTRVLGSSLFVSSVNDSVKLYSNAGATVNYDAYISNALVSSYALTWYTPQNPFAGVTLSGQTRAAGETGFRGTLGSRTSSSPITTTVAAPTQFAGISIGARVRFFNSTNDYVEGIWGGCSTRMLNLQTGQSTWEAKDYYEISFSDVFGFNFSGFTGSTQLRVYASNSPTLFSYVGQFNNNFVLTRPIVNGEVFFFTTSAAQGQLSAIGVR